jgi:phosphoglycerate kinase
MYPKLADADIQGKRVLLRAGFDVEIENGKITDATRIEALVPTMKYILQNASLVIMAHQGRPKGERVPDMSQKPLVPVIEKLLGTKVQFAENCTGDDTMKMAKALKKGEVLLLENLRYDRREEKNDEGFGEELAALADVYVNDAFTNCHRAHASMVQVPRHLPSYMGLQLSEEVDHLSQIFDQKGKKIVLIISGVKMETKVPVIEHFLTIGKDILLGGGIANTFVAARGFDVAKSKYESEMIDEAQKIMLESQQEGRAVVHIPRDVVVATEPSEQAEKIDIPVEDIAGDMAIFDIGKVTIKRYTELLETADIIIWNGPLGLYELNRFSHGTKRIAEAVSAATKRGAKTFIGGGDTIDFHVRYSYPMDVYTFVSTGGGAMLEFISGKELPALQALRK